MSAREFIQEWRHYGFRVAKNNFLLANVMRHIGARKYKVGYLK